MVAPAQTKKLHRTRQQQTDNRPLNDVQRQAAALEGVTAESLENIFHIFELLTAIAQNTFSSMQRESGYLAGTTITGPAYSTISQVALGPLAAGQIVLARASISDWNASGGGGSNSRFALIGPATIYSRLQYFPNVGATRGTWAQAERIDVPAAGDYVLAFQIQGGTTVTIQNGAGYLIEGLIYGLQL